SSSYRMIGQSLYVGKGWRTISRHINASANPAYARAIELDVSVYNHSGAMLGPQRIRVPPFGTAWIDLGDLFVEALIRHLAASGDRGSYTVYCADGAAIGYHFLYDAAGDLFAADHTRPAMKYHSMGYGAAPVGDDASYGRKLSASVKALAFQLFDR